MYEAGHHRSAQQLVNKYSVLVLLRVGEQHHHHDLVDEQVVDRLSEENDSLETERMAAGLEGHTDTSGAASPPPARG